MVGTTLGHYRILEQLGRGGVGEVYRAEDTVLKRQVALKVLRKPLAASTHQIDRLQREAEVLASLDHPNIVSIHTVEEADGIRFLTMQLVEGEVLSDLILRGDLSSKEILLIGVELADAVAAAHSKGIIHRDLKPSNIMVTTEGRAKVLDFGLAKLHEGLDEPFASDATTETLSEQGRLIGTIHYMSPEQAKGEPVGPTSDIFSMGVVLYEMCTGERPFNGDSKVAVLSEILSKNPPPIWKITPEPPYRLGRVVQSSLAKEPEHRQGTAEELRDQLREIQEELQASESHSSGAFSQILHGSSWITLNRYQFLVGAALFLAVALTAAWAILRDTSTVFDRLQVDYQEALVTWPSSEEAGTISPSGDAWAFISNRGGEGQIWIGSVGGSEPRAVRSGAYGYRNPVWSPDGQQLAFLEELEGEVTLVVVSLWGEEVRQPFAIDRSIDDVGLVRWLSGGIYLYFNDTDRRTKAWLWRFDPAAERMELITDPEKGALFEAPDHVIHIDVSRDERRLVWVGLEGESSDLFMSDIRGLRSERLTADTSRALSPRWWGPKDRLVAYVSNESGQFDVWILDPKSKERRPLTSSPLEESNLSVSAAGDLLTADVVRERSNLWAVRADGSSAPVQITNDTRSDIWPAAARNAPAVIFHRSRSALEAGFSPFETEIFLMTSVAPGQAEPNPLVEDGFGGKLSSDGGYVAFLRNKLVDAKSRMSLWVQAAERTGRPTLVTKDFVASPILFDTWSWMWNHFSWSPEGSILYFVEWGEGGTECIVEIAVDRSELAGRRELFCSETAEKGFGDLVASPGGDRLLFVQKADGFGTGGAVEVIELENPLRRTTLAEFGAGPSIFVRGWRQDGSIVILRETESDEDGLATEVLILEADGQPRRAGILTDTGGADVTFDQASDTLYFARAVASVWEIADFSLVDRRVIQLVENRVPGITFSGLDMGSDGSVLFAKRVHSRDIWRIGLGPANSQGKGD